MHTVLSHDRHLLGMQWDGKLYVDTALPFGLHLAPKIFTALADGLMWIIQAVSDSMSGVRVCVFLSVSAVS